MADDPLVQQLLDELLDSDATPEQVCGPHPEVLPRVRDRWRQMRRARAELDALFPPAGEPEAGPRPADGPALPAVPGYEVEAVLGRGGMGVVFRAKHLRLNRTVALKMVLAGAYAGPSERERFQREAEAVAALRHPNVVQIYDVGDSDGRPYFTMEFVDGGTLDRTLVGTPRPPRDAAALLATLAEAVHAAHAGGIVHRDLKPANILLTADGTPKIADFGLARRLDGEAGLTRTGTAVGTPSYMAPEQAGTDAVAVGPAADTYALGAILYELLTGRPPFRGETADVTVYQVLSCDPVPPSRRNAKVPRDLETICLKCLQKDPRRRYATAAELAEDLHRFLRGEAIAARQEGSVPRLLRRVRRRPALAAAVAVGTVACVLLVCGGLWLLSDRAATGRAADEDLRDMEQRLRNASWNQAEAALARAKGRVGAGASPEQILRMDRAAADLALVKRLERTRLEFADSVAGILLFDRCLAEYEASFAAAGLGGPADPPDDVAARVQNSNIKAALVAALDHWSSCGSNKARRAWALRVARLADRDFADPAGWRDRARDPAVRADKAAFAQLIAATPFAEQSVALLLALEPDFPPQGPDRIRFLKHVQSFHPDDFWANRTLAAALPRDTDAKDAVRYIQAAVAIRPQAAVAYNELGVYLAADNRSADAIVAFEEAIRLDPAAVQSHLNLANHLQYVGRLDEAVARMRRAFELLPHPIAPKPVESQLHAITGGYLLRAGRYAEALEEYRTALAIDAANGDARRYLRLALGRAGRWEEMRREWKADFAANPPDHNSYYGYAELCLFLGNEDEYRRARATLIEKFGTATDPSTAERTGRACLLLPPTGDELLQAVALVERAAAADRTKSASYYPYFQFARGLAEYRQGRFDRTVEILRGDAARVTGPNPRLLLAMALHGKGHVEEARKELAAAIAGYDWRPIKIIDQDGWIRHVLRREAERLLFPNLPAFLAGKYQPRDNDERLAFLGACRFEGRAPATARLYTDAFAAAPRLAEDFRVGHGYNAALAAAAASRVAGTAEPERVRWRTLAREWLLADLAAWNKSLGDTAKSTRDTARWRLTEWQADPDLECLRDPAELEKLPPEERKTFIALWAEVAAVLKRAAEK